MKISALKASWSQMLATLFVCTAFAYPYEVNAAAPKIVIVGGGLAGLSCANALCDAGLKPTVYEGSDRLGGRCHTGHFPNGQVYEHGGELIDQNHHAIRFLAQSFGLQLDNLVQQEVTGTENTFTVMDYTQVPPQPIAYSYKDASRDLTTIYSKLQSDLQACSYPSTYFLSTSRGREIDSMTLESYINYLTEELIPSNLPPSLARSGAYSKLAQLLKVAYNIEFGAEPSNQSPLNMLYLLGYSGPGQLKIFGPSNEKYHIRGGNEQLVLALAGAVQSHGSEIYTGYRLTSVERNTDSTYKVLFSTANGIETVDKIDRLVLAIPFSTMRSPLSTDTKAIKKDNWSVDITKSGFSNLKKYAIKNLGISNNSKLNAQFQNRFWIEADSNGETFITSNPMTASPLFTRKEQYHQNTWEVTRAQLGASGVLVNYTGGVYSSENFLTTSNPINFDLTKSSGRNARNSFIKQAMDTFLASISIVVPTTPQTFVYSYDESNNINNVDIDHWADRPWQRGAYSFWSPGQYAAGKATADANGNAVAYTDPQDPTNPMNFIVAFAGIESQAEPMAETDELSRNCHFAGEHTSYDYQGYLNGAVDSGIRAANEVLYAFKKLNIE